ncbi:hypothetical protein HELRODRAFT_112795 [Helobdella robusta]|uniref:Aldehyde dehydrogenase domain-containing protein n=1 Tax=Helobdella robusta TaxID=6412 RepID=T1EFM2_HELRO|nr:hypothetical protein HELRODRAFT_112795 [Helobdella robusta]ESO01401.1 hypothetical protein HELRODRAFT_112795 [Helobdella robusta]
MSVVGKPMHYINGGRLDPENDEEMIDVIQPSTGKVLRQMRPACKETVDKAVKCAKDAFKEWRLLAPSERGRILLKAAALLRERVEEVAEMEVLNNGKTIFEARFDIEDSAGTLEFLGGIATTELAGQHMRLPGGSFGYTVREPLGVVVGIGAWNYPFQTAVWKSAPALVCGNAMVYKPSEFTPVTSLLLAELYKDAGVPDGVFNVVQGKGQVGQMLCEHPDVAKVSLTGSVPSGVKVYNSCAKDIKCLTLELGGKSPLIMFEDCDLDNAVKGALIANYLSQGQVCTNGTRVFVHESIYDKFVEKLLAAVRRIKIGDPMDEETRVGATISKRQFDIVMGFVDRAKKQGAKVLCGGERVDLAGPLSGGYYISPCVLGDVTDGMEVAINEVFGPVMSLLKFKDEVDVVQRANNSLLGLAAGLFTKDLKRAHEVASKLEAGFVWINTYSWLPAEMPFGGVKRSGIGRENSKEVLNYYTNWKSVYVELNDVASPF